MKKVVFSVLAPIVGIITLLNLQQAQAQPSGWPNGAPWPLFVKYDASQVSSNCSGTYIFEFTENAYFSDYSTGFNVYEFRPDGSYFYIFTNSSCGTVQAHHYGTPLTTGFSKVTIPSTYQASLSTLGKGPHIIDARSWSQCGLSSKNYDCSSHSIPGSDFLCSAVQTNVICSGQSNGTASISILSSSSASSYTYTWSGGSTTIGSTSHDLSGLSAGYSTVSVTDGSKTATCQLAILEFGVGLTASHPDCNSTTGSIVASGTTGSGDYGYVWYNGNTTSTITGLNAGTYCVTVTDQIVGCVSADCDDVLPPNQTGTPPNDWPCDAPWPFSVAYNQSDFATGCSGTSTFTFSSAATYANRPFEGYWYIKETVNKPSGGTVLVEFANFYEHPRCNPFWRFNMESSTGCSSSSVHSYVNSTGLYIPNRTMESTIDLTSLTQPQCSGFNSTNWSSCDCLPPNSSVEPISCALIDPTVACVGEDNGSALVDVGGGNTGTTYTYTWNGGSATSSTGYRITGLAAGVYTVTVSQGDESTTCAVTISSSAAPIRVFYRPSNYGQYNLSVKGASDGSIQTFVQGGLAPYTYNWVGNGTSSGPNQNGLEAGSYFLRVIDDQGCSGYGGPWYLREP
ncbi:MAG: hypothetical protein H6606_00090 [Flavobacteriales bacterium]|nr:hypothetical protein [Flavobacteriales bacterium]